MLIILTHLDLLVLLVLIKVFSMLSKSNFQILGWCQLQPKLCHISHCNNAQLLPIDYYYYYYYRYYFMLHTCKDLVNFPGETNEQIACTVNSHCN